MKKFLLLIVILYFVTHAHAQPTLTAADNNPVIGDIFYNHHCATGGISKGTSGAGVTWDFSALTVTSDDSTKYISPVGTPYAAAFPASNIAAMFSSWFDYYFTGPGSFEYVGIGQSAGNDVFSDFEDLNSYPMSYGTVALDANAYTQASSSTHSYGTDTLIGDAWGTLTLPAHTYTNVLRVHVIVIRNDSVLSGPTPVVTHARYDYYFWYTPGFHSQLLSLLYDTSGTGISHLTEVIYRTRSTVGVSGINPGNDETRIFPNPSNDIIHLSFNAAGNEAVTITITDMMGKAVAEKAQQNVSAGLNDIKLSVASLPAGIYTLLIQSGTGVVARKIQMSR